MSRFILSIVATADPNVGCGDALLGESRAANAAESGVVPRAITRERSGRTLAEFGLDVPDNGTTQALVNNRRI